MCEALKELMKEEIREARQEAAEIILIANIKSLMNTMTVTASQAMDALEIPSAKQRELAERM